MGRSKVAIGAQPSAGTGGGQAGQEVRFCRSVGGIRLAYATHGSGPPLVVVSCWLSHLQYDWQSPVWRHFLDELGAVSSLVRYDERGFGLSDWVINDYSLDTRVADLEAIVDSLGLDRFALLGMSQGGPVAIAFAVRHPERLTRLVLHGTWACLMRERSAEQRQLAETYVSMIRVGWARPDSLFRRVFTNLLIPGASEEQMRWVDALQRMSTSTENAAWTREERQKIDVTALLPHVTTPTLVLHARDDAMIPFEEGRLIASLIPGARLVPLESRNHILLADEAAWSAFRAEVNAFIEPDRRRVKQPDAQAVPGDLTSREYEILRLAADGMSNEAIAKVLALSARTVERHLSNVYVKLGVSGKAARAAAVAHAVRTGMS